MEAHRESRPRGALVVTGPGSEPGIEVSRLPVYQPSERQLLPSGYPVNLLVGIQALRLPTHLYSTKVGNDMLHVELYTEQPRIC